MSEAFYYWKGDKRNYNHALDWIAKVSAKCEEMGLDQHIAHRMTAATRVAVKTFKLFGQPAVILATMNGSQGSVDLHRKNGGTFGGYTGEGGSATINLDTCLASVACVDHAVRQAREEGQVSGDYILALMNQHEQSLADHWWETVIERMVVSPVEGI